MTQAMVSGLSKAAALAWAVVVSAGVHTATGTMTAFDPATRALTVASATGPAVYRVAPDARAWLGHLRLPVRRLPSYVGAQVTLAWAEVDGVRTTHTVRLEEPGGGRGR